MKCHTVLSVFLVLFFITAENFPAGAEATPGSIVSVKMYQNQALVSRKIQVSLKQGMNTIIINNLPPQLYDWSVQGGISGDFKGKILALEISKHALALQRQEKLRQIEEKLKALRDQDQSLIDNLSVVHVQEKFLQSIMSFSENLSSKDLSSGLPQMSVWVGTLSFVKGKTADLLKEKRKIENERIILGKEIQKWEYELSRIGGTQYYNAYLSNNKSLHSLSAALTPQTFEKGLGDFENMNTLLSTPGTDLQYEKQVMLTLYSPAKTDTTIEMSYQIPGTEWGMNYDIRASESGKQVAMTVFADIRQTTGEDWNDVNLFLSTGQPVFSIAIPQTEKWYLDIVQKNKYAYGSSAQFAAGSVAESKVYDETASEKYADYSIDSITTKINQKGPNFEVSVPYKLSIPNANSYHKKTIHDYTLIEGPGTAGDAGGSIKFLYELYPSAATDSFLKVTVTNTSALPWLQGEAQIFLENEFMGKSTIPYTPQGGSQDIVLGIEKRISAKKELVKKFEDTQGMFGNGRRILYQYKITVNNEFPVQKLAFLHDFVPVSRNKKIEVRLENLSLPFMTDEKTLKDYPLAQGLRKWQLSLLPHGKLDITYDVVITFDGDLHVTGFK